jgi:hypothetical protein
VCDLSEVEIFCLKLAYKHLTSPRSLDADHIVNYPQEVTKNQISQLLKS